MMKPTSKLYQPGIFDSVPAVARHAFIALAGPGVDAFRISRPVSGAYFWCPPVRQGKLDSRQLGL